jgi:AraC family transcriptional regulator of adaptative response/methylated-DNA-[protein]-cysteine methyltransferase
MQDIAETAGRDYDRVERAIRFIAEHRLEQPSLEVVADAMGVSPFHAQRVFSSWAGLSPKRFLGLLTVEHAKLLRRGEESVMGAAFEVGLSGGSRLHDLFLAFEAITPGEYKRLGTALTLRWGVHETPFGPGLFVVSERGLARLVFLDGGHLNHALAEAGPTGRRAASSRTAPGPVLRRRRRSDSTAEPSPCACSPRARHSRSRSGGR